jgi:hypothetical protein
VKGICEIIQLGLIPDNWKVVTVHDKERDEDGSKTICYDDFRDENLLVLLSRTSRTSYSNISLNRP